MSKNVRPMSMGSNASRSNEKLPTTGKTKHYGTMSETTSLNPAPARYTKTAPNKVVIQPAYKGPGNVPAAADRWPGDNPPLGAVSQ